MDDNHQRWLDTTTVTLMAIENGMDPRQVFRELWRIMEDKAVDSNPRPLRPLTPEPTNE